MPSDVSRSSNHCRFAGLLAAAGFSLLVANCAGAQSTYVYGRAEWFAVGDTLQFVGDANLGASGYDDCPWDEGCEIDSGFAFRKVTDVDVEECTAEELPSDTCYVCVVVCCFFMGDCEGEHCTSGGMECWESEEECGNDCLCMGLLVVTAYNASPGDAEFGCYTLDLICDPDEECENGTTGCDVVNRWYAP